MSREVTEPIKTMTTICKRLTSAEQSLPDRLHLVSVIFSLVFRQGQIRPDYQKACAQTGIVDVLLDICGKKDENQMLRARAFNTLGTIAFKNTPICKQLLETRNVVDLVMEALDREQNITLRQRSLYALNNITCELQGCHETLQLIVPRLVGILQDPAEDVSLRRTSVTCLCSFAVKPETHVVLVQHNAVGVLVEVMATGEEDMLPTSAMVAVANVCQLRGDFAPLELAHPRVIQQIRDALTATLEGQDYPPGSNGFYTAWKIVLGIKNLCCFAKTRNMLRNAGVVPVLRQALEKPLESEEQLTRHTLSALWLLCADDGK